MAYYQYNSVITSKKSLGQISHENDASCLNSDLAAVDADDSIERIGQTEMWRK